MYSRWKLIYQAGDGIPVSVLTPPHFCACTKPGLGFPTSYVVVFFMFSELRGEVIVRLVNIGGIVGYHCLNCLFINLILCSLNLFLEEYGKLQHRSKT